MMMQTPSPATADAASRRILPFMLVLFVGSGCAALVYEIVWFQLLQLVIGSAPVSLSVLLGTFMGGMCLGSLLLPRFVSARRHPLRVYAAMEVGIGVCGVAILFLLLSPGFRAFYTEHAGQGRAGVVVLCVALLSIPTLLMGATLPAMARWVEATPRGVSWLGFFYGGNIAGAVFGCLLAGFYLLRVHDMQFATFVAVGMNVAVALAAFVLAAVAPYAATAAAADDEALSPEASPDARAAYFAIALSGMAALGGEVVWTRLLSLLFGGTVYTFSIILAVFLVGLGIGSSVGSAVAGASRRPRVALGWCQLLLVGAVAWAAHMISSSLPFKPVDAAIWGDPWAMFRHDLVRSASTILPAAALWGASFPLALAAVAARGRDAGRVVGGVYAANTVGAIAGALVFNLLLIPVVFAGDGMNSVAAVGTQNAQRVLVLLPAFTALFLLLPVLWQGADAAAGDAGPPPARFRPAGAALLAGVAAVGGLLAWGVSAVPPLLVAYGRTVARETARPNFLFVGEGMNASVAVTQDGTDGARYFHVSGKVEASSLPTDMRLQRMLAHVPGAFHPRPKSVLIVGCGAGVTAGSFLVHPDVERVVVCEIEPLIPKVVANHFGPENYDLMKGVDRENPRTVNGKRVEVVYDDARHYMLTSADQFDIITSDPIHPWVKGAATLYTKEYFELCKQRLNPGGFVTQWVPLYESDLGVVKSEAKTFFAAFPNGTWWGNDEEGAGYDSIVLGQVDKLTVDVDALQRRLERPEFAAMAKSLQDVGFYTAADLLATYAGRAADLGEWMKDGEINRDRDLRLQYLAGLHANHQRAGDIYADVLRHRRFPEDLFTGPDAAKLPLRQALAGSGN